jgi:hypothetical protein
VVNKPGESPQGFFDTSAYEADAKATGLVDEPCPEELRYIWEWFLKLNRYRQGSGYGVNPLEPTQYEAWARLEHVAIETWEFEVLTSLDHLFVQHCNRKSK